MTLFWGAVLTFQFDSHPNAFGIKRLKKVGKYLVRKIFYFFFTKTHIV